MLKKETDLGQFYNDLPGFLDGRYVLEQEKIRHIETLIDGLKESPKEKNKEKIAYLKKLAAIYEKLERQNRKEFMINTQIQNLESAYTRSYKLLIAEFEKFYNDWLKAVSNKKKIRETKNEVLSYLCRLAYERLERDRENKMYTDIIEDYENEIETDDPHREMLSFIVVEEPIHDLLGLAKLVIESLSENNEEYSRKINELFKEREANLIEHHISNEKLKELRTKVRKLQTEKKQTSKEDIIKIIDVHRFKNGSINYSSLGKAVGCTNHTAKKICNNYGIK